MRNNKSILALLALLIPLSCAREMIAPDIPEQGGVPLNIDGEIAQIPTRAGESGFANGDAIGLFAVNYSENNTVAGTLVASGNQADNAKYTYDAAAFKWTTGRPVYYKDIDTHADLYVYYPYQSNIGDVDAFGFEVKKDQTTAAVNGILGGYEASDFLWCKVSDVTPSENKVRVRLEHRMAGAKVILQEGTGFSEDEFDSAAKSVILLNTTRKATIDFSTGTVTPVGAAQSDGIVMAPQSNGTYRAVLVPQSVNGVPLFAITIDGQTYRYTHGSAISFASGNLTEFTVIINKTSPTGDYTFEVISTSITAWTEDANTHAGEARQYYVVNVTIPGTLGQTIVNAGKNPDRIRNLKVTGSVNADDFYFMRDNMAILEAVNMKECRVENDIIPNSAFSGKKTLVSFVFPETLTGIDDGAFNSTNLAGALVIPDNVVNLGGDAFNSTKISSLYLPYGLITIGGGAFRSCRSLTGDLILPDSVESIGAYAFEGCNFSGNLHLPSNLREVYQWAFSYTGNFVGDLVIPERINSLPIFTFFGSSFTGRLILNNCVDYGMYCFNTCGFTGTLVIPEGVVTIPENCFRTNNFSSVILPSTLKSIDMLAFVGESLTGEIVFPEGLVSIGNGAFSGHLGITSIDLPSTLQTIEGGAFSGCYGISRIVSHSTIPPSVFDGAFDGIGKDNFCVEVPEQSIVRYQTESGWSDFKRIEAYQDFNISRRIIRALNDGKTRSFILRCPAGMAWSVTDKPDWVTVSPASGTGKTDVSVTINTMARTDDTFQREEWNGSQYVSTGTYEGRAGEIVFELTAKGNQSKIRVEQFDYDYVDGDVFTKQTHTRGNGINIVLTGDCYDALDIAAGSMMNDMDEAVEHFFDVEPFHTYQDYFNVYYVFAESDESGIGTLNTIKDVKFGSYVGETRMVAPNVGLVFEYALKSPVTSSNLKDALVILIDNTSMYEGVTYMYGDGSAIACCPKSSLPYPYDFRGIIQHEAGGHGFGKLGDEYIYHNAFISTCPCGCCDHGKSFNTMKARGWFRNMELTGNMNDVAWSHLIFNPQYSDKVDVYEGGYMHSRGVFRSEATSCMNNNIPYYSAISRQAMVERILDLSGEGFTLEKFYANDSFRVGTIRKRGGPTPNMNAEVHYSHEHGPVYMGERPVLN